MEDKTDLRTMEKQIQEIQTTQNLILERFRQIFPDDASGNYLCKCNSAETIEGLEKKIEILEKKIEILEESEIQSSKEIKDLSELMERLRCQRKGNEKTITIDDDVKNEIKLVTELNCKDGIIREDSHIVASRVDIESVHSENKIDSKSIDETVYDRSSAVVINEEGAQSSLRDSKMKASALNERMANTDINQIIAESISHVAENAIETNTFEQVDEECRIDDEHSARDVVMKPDSNVSCTVPNQKQKLDNECKDIEIVRKNQSDELTKVENKTRGELPENNCSSKQNLKATSEQTRGEMLPSVKTSEQSRFIPSPNVTKISPGKRTKYKLVEQREQKYYDSNETWDFKGYQAQQEGSKIVEMLGGIHNVLCVDISASMAEGEAWSQAKTFVTDYIRGLEGLPIQLKQDNVALVTFGHETRVVQRLTDDFESLGKAFGDIKLGGPSPMYGGLAVAKAAVQSASTLANVNGTQMLNKVILITDGKPTANTMYAGPDDAGVYNLEETKSAILNNVDGFKRMMLDLFCVPVGNANTEFLKQLTSKADGKMLDFRGGKKLSLYLMEVVANSQSDIGSLFDSVSASGVNLSGIKTGTLGSLGSAIGAFGMPLEGLVKMKEALAKGKENYYYNEGESNVLPPVGTRVRRGVDWDYSDDQDSNKPGTIIGNNPQGLQVFVEWDINENRDVYMCGADGKYEVLSCDEPRVVPPGRKIAVGCVVIPGPCYKHGFGRERTEQGGAVIKVLSDVEKVQVRWWHNGERGDYSYGEDGEVQLRCIINQISDPTDDMQVAQLMDLFV